MKSEKYIKGILDRTDVRNAENLQLMVIKYIEDHTPLASWVETKIALRCAKYGFRRSRIIAELARSFVLCTEYCKSANRQRIAEKAQIKNFNRNGLKVTKLPDTGHNAVRLMDGELVYGNLGRLARATKSIDAQHGNDFLYLKWTVDSGGAQENQWKDVLDFIDAANRYIETHTDDTRFVIVLDGQFYKGNWARYKQYANARLLVETSDSYIARNQAIEADTTPVSEDVVLKHTNV